LALLLSQTFNLLQLSGREFHIVRGSLLNNRNLRHIAGRGQEDTVQNAGDELLKIERGGGSLCLMNKFTAADVLELPVAERLQLVSDIWDSVADAPEALDLSVEDKRLSLSLPPPTQ
jgi:hypothetical protein